jgi:hypothetical protein
MVVIPGWGLTPKLGVTLRAASVWNINHAGSFQTYGVSCNNPYQPFITATTTEVPSYLSYLSLAYQRVYTVASRVTVELVNSTVADTIACAVAMDGDTVGTTNINTLSETRAAQCRSIGYYSGGSNRAVLRSSFSPRQYIGVPPSSPDNTCVVGAAPPNQYYWIVGLQSVAGGTGNVSARIVVEYDVVFSELISPPP